MKAGVGVGGGIKFNPVDGLPGDQAPGTRGGVSVAVNASLSGSIGPASGEIKTEKAGVWHVDDGDGTRLNARYESVTSPLKASGSIKGKTGTGLSASATAGVEIGVMFKDEEKKP